ncbi:uncharacterized protein EKO05_0002927 [Ascochyta rabiei]|uniref:Uncharacterized protein n=1 Tax=Didymella rabiei TaxID=5454 RepID=A0A162X1L5_DIDRA|nr:uncharacterized protein EKO05_0002927 [Ascochyta rabiei]KZM19310.1 hypothetical protein ST47_g9527 [Ascochyta rabiei]UPX12377.1 hypothetical protein EKO05_0002927 [Ascochyta rabiei]
MDSYVAEQKCLLPMVSPTPGCAPQRRTFVRRHHDLIESLTLALIFSLAVSQCLTLYGIHSLPYLSPSNQLITFLSNLAGALRVSIPASLPTATLLFIATPYVARPDRIVASWYLILLCYLVGSTSGALLLLWGLGS